MSAKTTSSSSSDISKKVQSYFASLSSASSRILDDVRSISLAHSRRQNHTFNSKTNSAKTSPGGWDSLSEKQRAELVIETLVPGDLEQRYRSLAGDTASDNGSLAWSGGPLGPLASFVDPSQSFPIVEISTGPPLPTVGIGEPLSTESRGRSIVIEEDINGHKVPITWRDEHAQAFSWYNQSCDPITPSRDAVDSIDDSAQYPRFPPPFVNLCGAEDINAGVTGVDLASDGPESLNVDNIPILSRLSTSVSGGTLDSGLSNVTSDGGPPGEVTGGRISRRSSRASTPERRRSPLMRPKQAPPPPPPGAPHNNKDATLKESEKEAAKDRLCSGDFVTADSTARTLSGRREISTSKESVASAHTAATAPQASLTGGFVQPPRPSSAQPTGKKRQAPKPPVSPVNPPVSEPHERASSLSLASVGSMASVNSVGSSSSRTAAASKWQSQTERPRSSFCPSADPDQPHILPEALAPETTGGAPDPRASPLLQPANAALRCKAPPQQLKKVVPPVAPKFEPPRLGVKSAAESIVSTPVVNDDIPKTGFAFLDNW